MLSYEPRAQFCRHRFSKARDHFGIDLCLLGRGRHKNQLPMKCKLSSSPLDCQPFLRVHLVSKLAVRLTEIKRVEFSHLNRNCSDALDTKSENILTLKESILCRKPHHSWGLGDNNDLNIALINEIITPRAAVVPHPPTSFHGWDIK